jgi:hypothetical protein
MEIKQTIAVVLVLMHILCPLRTEERSNGFGDEPGGSLGSIALLGIPNK